MSETKFIKIEGVIEMSGCSKRHIMEEIKRKTLRAYKPGKALLFDPAEVEKWIKRKVAS